MTTTAARGRQGLTANPTNTANQSDTPADAKPARIWTKRGKAKAHPPLTQLAIKQALARAKQHKRREVLKDPQGRGLQLRISATAHAVWSGVIHINHRTRTITVGDLTDSFDKDAARHAWDIQRHAIRLEGADPTKARRDARHAAAPVTLLGLVELYEKGKTPQSWQDQLRPAITNRCFKPLLDQPLAQIACTDLQACIDNWKAVRSAAFSAAALLTVLQWGAKTSRGLVPSALLAIEFERKGDAKDRWFNRGELHALLPVLQRESNKGNHYASGLLLQLYLAARISEIAEARWSWIDWVDETMTAPRTKNGTRHTWYLPRQAMALLKAIAPKVIDPDALIFAGPQNWDNAIKRLQALSSTDSWTSHVLRHTATRWLQFLKVDVLVRMAITNHSASKVEGAHGAYTEPADPRDIRAAMQRFANMLGLIAEGRPTDVVLFSEVQKQAA